MRMKRLVKIFQYPIDQVQMKMDPVGFARRIGVNFVEGGLHLYGAVAWSTEPWIITIGNDVHITNNVTFVTHDGGTLLFRHLVPDLEITKPIRIGDHVYIGTNTTILPGVTIGSHVVIGAGSIVTRDIPDHSVAVGNPARVIKTDQEYFEKLQRESLHLGHLKGKEKDDALKRHFGYRQPDR